MKKITLDMKPLADVDKWELEMEYRNDGYIYSQTYSQDGFSSGSSRRVYKLSEAVNVLRDYLEDITERRKQLDRLENDLGYAITELTQTSK